MSKLSLSPQQVRGSKSWWYYENKASIDVYIDVPGDNRVVSARIPARLLLETLKRQDAVRKSKERPTHD